MVTCGILRRVCSSPIGYDRYTLCEVGTAYDPEKGTAFFKEYKALWEKLVKG